MPAYLGGSFRTGHALFAAFFLPSAERNPLEPKILTRVAGRVGEPFGWHCNC
jgi:hypothetical protein